MLNSNVLHNKLDRKHLEDRLAHEPFQRRTVSFYCYRRIDHLKGFRDDLFTSLEALQVLGRIYLAKEGINAQISVPVPFQEDLVRLVHSHWPGLDLKWAVEEPQRSFLKLVIKIREKIVADGLRDDEYDVENCGVHLDAHTFNEYLDHPDSVVVDMRNFYESEVGHFEGAICPDVETFREQLPVVKELLQDQKDKKVLLYCTGGIRCEKASAYLRHHGFSDVYQLKGGIIDYAHQVQEKGLPCRFKGKNFVFDDRMGERITEDVIAQCHQCGEPCDHHTNCRFDPCHLLFIQCDSCQERFEGYCSEDCREFDEKGEPPPWRCSGEFRSRIRPKLKVSKGR